jgi:hypothetical protein
MMLLAMLCAAMMLAGCAEEPDRIVGANTGDGRFRLTLEATDDWVRSDFSLPVKVRVESLTGPVLEPWYTVIELVANNGDVSSSSVEVSFDGVAEGETAEAADAVFEAWVTFEAANLNVVGQGEIHAIFLGATVVLKLRITPESW